MHELTRFVNCCMPPGSDLACCLLQKPAGTLPIRKHKFVTTPNTGQAITKFFDKKEEQVVELKQFT